jgi:hypothetical protein
VGILDRLAPHGQNVHILKRRLILSLKFWGARGSAEAAATVPGSLKIGVALADVDIAGKVSVSGCFHKENIAFPAESVHRKNGTRPEREPWNISFSVWNTLLSQAAKCLKRLGGGYRNRTGLHGFAIRCGQLILLDNPGTDGPDKPKT